MSDSIQDFGRFALAFEQSFASDDWTAVGEHVTDDLVWIVRGPHEPIAGTFVGRDAAIAAVDESCAAFDRRFDRREPKILAGPTPIPGGVHLAWEVTYSREGIDPFVLRGEEWDFFRDGKLDLHRESIHNTQDLYEYLAKHSGALRPAR
jgi:hypothetical protein